MKKYIFALLLFSSCIKSDERIERGTGVVADDELLKNKTPLIISESFKRNGLSEKYEISWGEDQAKGRRDRQAPTVQITNPHNGDTVSGIVRITINATDNVGVTQLYLTINGSLIVFSGYYDWAPSADGIYTLQATAKDAAGNAASQTIVVTKSTPIIVVPPPSTLPTSWIIKMPPVINQGSEGSCVAMAEVYYTMSALKRVRMGDTSFNSNNIFSPEFTYDLTKASTSCGSGSSVINVLNFTKGYGSCLYNTLPYTSGTCDPAVITQAMKNEALNYKSNGYAQILLSDVTAWKTKLSQNIPLIISILPDENFWNAKGDFTWSTYGSSTYGIHCVAVVGYDDTRRAVRIVNSWGANWGDAGYCWISYELLSQLVTTTYIML